MVRSYSNTVHLGNWFEDKLQTPSQSTSRVLCDYGVREYTTDNMHTAEVTAKAREGERGGGSNGSNSERNSERNRGEGMKRLARAARNNGGKGGFRMAQANTFSEAVIKRVGSAPETGFDSLLPETSGKSVAEFGSCSRDAYGVPPRLSVTSSNALRSSTAPFAGQGKPAKVKDYNNTPKSLSGEVWKDGDDPQKSTLAQRAWMYGEDPAIHYKLCGFPKLDINTLPRTGFPIGEKKGDGKDGYRPGASYKRVAKLTKCSDVQGQNAKFGTNVWMDGDDSVPLSS